MDQADDQYAQAKLLQLKTDYQVEILMDWGREVSDPTVWKPGTWTRVELDRLQNAIDLMTGIMGGRKKFVQNLCGVTVRKADIGSHGGEAFAHTVSLSHQGTFSSWTVIHEFGHAWDANYGWRLSRLLEKYTGGFTSRVLSLMKRLMRLSDSGIFRPESKPGRYGRWPGCNQAGYFYGDRPSGSNWNFNRLEDFAESVAMYIGWGSNNDLSQHAHNRIVRYQLQNGDRDPFNLIDNWKDYARWFYPEGGDYTKTLRWRFMDDLVNGRLKIP